mgnify:FL=1
MEIKQKVESSGHWYQQDGTPAYTQIAKNGNIRGTTVRDARAQNLSPSVTTVLGVANKPALQSWLQQQVLLAALTLPRNENESEAEWIERVMQDSKATGKAAAERGTRIHEIIESYFDQVYMPEKPAYLDEIDKILSLTFGNQLWKSERSFAKYGFGGKVDLSANGFVVDFKTTEKDLDKVEPYHEHEMQLAAYRMGLDMPTARCAIIFVNGNTNQVKLCEIGSADLENAWECFNHLLSFYRLKNKL